MALVPLWTVVGSRSSHQPGAPIVAALCRMLAGVPVVSRRKRLVLPVLAGAAVFWAAITPWDPAYTPSNPNWSYWQCTA